MDCPVKIGGPFDTQISFCNTCVKLHLKLQFYHEGTKTLRDDMYFYLGALETLWQNEHHQSFYLDQTGRSRQAAVLI